MASSGKPSLVSMFKTVILTSLLFAVPIGIGRFLGGFEGLELAAYDQFLRWRSPERPDDRIVVVTIDDNDIETLQQYPIHDGTLATALEKLVSYEPRGIGLDIARDVPQGPLAGRKQLTEVIKSSPEIVAGCLLSTENHPGSPPAPGSEDGGFAFADFPIDRDASVRRAKLVSTPGDYAKPHKRHPCNDASEDNEILSLSFQLAYLYLEDLQVDIAPTDTGEIQISQAIFKRLNPRFGSYARAETNDYQIMLNYRGGEELFRQIPITQLLEDKVDPRSIRDRIVLIGYTSEVSKDFLKTPYIQAQTGSRDMFGVLVHAQAVSQILSAALEQRPLIQSWPDQIEIIWILGWALGSGVIAFYTRQPILFLVGLVGAELALGGICYGLFVSQGLWVPWVPTLTVVVLTAIGVRLADLGGQSGYTQAMYELFREQFSREAGRDRQVDYLESLARRARSVRQGQEMTALLDPGEESAHLSSDMQTMYEQLEAKVRQEMAAEQAKQQAKTVVGGSDHKLNRMQKLLNRAQHSRHQPSSGVVQAPEKASLEDSDD